jgi:hypothetical protein
MKDVNWAKSILMSGGERRTVFHEGGCIHEWQVEKWKVRRGAGIHVSVRMIDHVVVRRIAHGIVRESIRGAIVVGRSRLRSHTHERDSSRRMW